jgi:hypothetical protein
MLGNQRPSDNRSPPIVYRDYTQGTAFGPTTIMLAFSNRSHAQKQQRRSIPEARSGPM